MSIDRRKSKGYLTKRVANDSKRLLPKCQLTGKVKYSEIDAKIKVMGTNTKHFYCAHCSYWHVRK